jgi:hypothetical protein
LDPTGIFIVLSPNLSVLNIWFASYETGKIAYLASKFKGLVELFSTYNYDAFSLNLLNDYVKSTLSPTTCKILCYILL